MKNVLVIGAGRSATFLLQYLNKAASKIDFTILLADHNQTLAEDKARELEHVTPIQVDTSSQENLLSVIEEVDVVVSMLPATMHI
ncbi:MAG: saccharopine dehydrogenase NADP-binding domain-containing protein, partial [Cyclobacteriaceae bacterium]